MVEFSERKNKLGFHDTSRLMQLHWTNHFKLDPKKFQLRLPRVQLNFAGHKTAPKNHGGG